MSALTSTDPIKLVDALDADEIRRELDELERREDALRVLYRAAVTRHRHKCKQPNKAEDVE